MRENSAFGATKWRFWLQSSASIGCLKSKCCFIDENKTLAIDDTLRNMVLSAHEVALSIPITRPLGSRWQGGFR